MRLVVALQEVMSRELKLYCMQSAMIYNIAIAFHDGLPVLFLAVLNMLRKSYYVVFKL